MSKRNPLLPGQMFGRLSVIEAAGKNRHGHYQVRCRCTCGGETVVSEAALRSRNTTSCGCYGLECVRMARRPIPNGSQFGRLTVRLRTSEQQSDGNYKYECQCSCGRVVRIVGRSLIKGASKSCGCLRKELAAKRFTKHGMNHSPEVEAYHNAKSRCTNPENDNFARYGGRGIEFRFTSTTQWIHELGPRPTGGHSVDRIDNNGHYEPGNIRWATALEQRHNQRRYKKPP